MKRKQFPQRDVPPLAPLPPRREPLTVRWRLLAALVFALYLALSAGHAVIVPVYETQNQNIINAPDEAAHRGYVDILVTEGRLPIQGDNRTYEWHQPPLYYSLVALAHRAGPHAERAVTIVIGAISIYVIFLTVRRLFPAQPVLAVLAMGFGALLPMRQAVYSSVGNDALLELFASLFFFAIIPAFTHGFTLRSSIVIGIVLGGALLTKASGILLVPVAIFALLLLQKIAGEPRRTVLVGAVVLLWIAFGLFSPVAVRNARLYREITPIRAFKQEFAGTSKATDWIGNPISINLWTGELLPGPELDRVGYFGLAANWTCRTFVAAYTPPRMAASGAPIFAVPSFYAPYGLLGITAVCGLTKLHFRRKQQFTGTQLGLIWMMFLFSAMVTLAFSGFVWTYFQAQGRYLYPAMLPLCLLSALGIHAVVPSERRNAVTLGILGLLMLLATAFLFISVQPAYR